MGIEIAKEEFEEADYARYAERLHECLGALETMVRRPEFGEGETSIGAELELNLVDRDGRPAPVNRQVLTDTASSNVTLEIDRFNMEINARPFALAGRPFEATEGELEATLSELRSAAARHDARVVAIGILPTLRREDLTSDALSEGVRYRALSRRLRQLRREPFSLHIDGQDELRVHADDVTYEGANTSFQVHLRTPPALFAATYNAAQIATGVALAVSGNSPLFLGCRLWEETRIALFRQSVDDRVDATADDWRPARVSFGHGWVRHGALELFQEAVHMHEALLPICSDQAPMRALERGDTPGLAELRLHYGTVWRWNRAVYDDSAGGHVRVELRALGAGPTVHDTVANAAFLVGLTLGLRARIELLLSQMTFGHARHNFYEAARWGLAGRMLWPSARGVSPEVVDARELALRAVEIARAGLVDHRVAPDEADRYLTTIRERVASGRTGARWQRQTFESYLDPSGDRERAALRMLQRYQELSEQGAPVHTWPC